MIFPLIKHANTKIQIHKYTNTAYDKVPESPNMLYIFEKRSVQGYQKWYLHESNMQIQKYKNTYTKIQHMITCQKHPTCGIFLKRRLFKANKNHIPMCQTRKYKNIKMQIHKYSIWRSARKTQHVVYFWKEDCSRISKIIFPCVKHAYTKYKYKIHKYSI